MTLFKAGLKRAVAMSLYQDMYLLLRKVLLPKSEAILSFMDLNHRSLTDFNDVKVLYE